MAGGARLPSAAEARKHAGSLGVWRLRHDALGLRALGAVGLDDFRGGAQLHTHVRGLGLVSDYIYIA